MNKTALVTGASRGIGFSIASKLKDLGIKVITPARSELDLLSNRSIDEFVKSLDSPIDILINNAGINPIAMATDLLDNDIEHTMQTNLIAPMRLTCGIVPLMIKNNYGRIVNISSIWSIVSKPGRLAYSVSKSGLNGMTRSLAVEMGKYNILINSVSPGFVNTELTKKNNSEKEIKAITEKIPLERLAEPEEIAELVAFLCSEKNSYITGQTIFIDGGYTCL